jgi:hypothetical protein
MQLPLHLQRGKAHVDAIKVSDDVEQEKEGNQAAGELGDQCRFETGLSRGGQGERRLAISLGS